ncbi:MAG: DUF2207 family protein [Acidimicrobiales bacterium]
MVPGVGRRRRDDGVARVAVAPRHPHPPPPPDPGPAGLELGGDEPPAVVNLLANGWKLRPEALPATLVDLAARGLLAFEPAGGERFVVRLLGAGDGSVVLATYERQVLNHVHGLASNGLVPCEALTTGPENESKSWRRSFERAVISDARARGLSQPRWGRMANAVLTVTALVPAVLTGLALAAIPETGADASNDDGGGLFAFGLIVWAVLLAVWRAFRAERDTDAGLAAAGRWLGLGENLQAGLFPELPPTAVAVWHRLLSYAAALEVAETTIHALPLGPESDTEAWSSAGGRWHLVHVRYPRRIPPGWGRPPSFNLWMGFMPAALSTAFLWYVLPLVDRTAQDLIDGRLGPSEGLDIPTWVVSAVLAVLAVVPSLVIIRGLWLMLLALSDVGRGRAVEGVVVRVRRRQRGEDRWVTYVAVDDGTSDRIRAWIPRPVPNRLGQRSHVRAIVTPRTGYVRELDVVPQPDRVTSGTGA